MKAKIVILIGLLNILTACTSLNDKCNKIPSGYCWSDVYPCGQRLDYLEQCKHSEWLCGYHYQFHDP